ncbi:conserved hypothetical protein, ribA/ribD-fused [Paenibacillus algorifonticola]|uniref:Uncharacterized protein n=2 Tax=Paenibacillus algorifonticola TaxID=684063 RepID=A0A1I2E2G1_9BACL|nr:conserved hypothetical protein, ribA/ribD-fused [Paenibacillus algorifonticola]
MKLLYLGGTYMTIYFYKIDDDYGCFSNFSKHGFELGNKYWMTSEHYFQAQKFVGTEYEEQVSPFLDREFVR